jgi:hypothetical protein
MAMIAKPFAVDALARTIRSMIEGGRPGKPGAFREP